MKTVRNFLYVLMMSALSAVAGAQNGTDVKIRYQHFLSNEYYLTETSPGEFFLARENPSSFHIETLGGGRYLMAVGTPVKSGDYAAGRYLFDDTNYRSQYGNIFDPPSDNCYIKTGEYVNVVAAVRKDRTLYVLGDEQVSDYATLESLAQAGKVKKIDLEQKNNFVFGFVLMPVEDNYPDGCYSIETETGGMIVIRNKDRVSIAPLGDVASVPAVFFFESDPPFVPGDGGDSPNSPETLDAGLVKFKRLNNPNEYLGSPFGDLLQPVNIYAYQDVGAMTTFYLDATEGQDHFLLAMDAEKIGDCIIGKYVCRSGIYAGRQQLEPVNAIHYGEALYVLGEEAAPDFSSLEELSSAGKIRKIDLKEKNDFRFYFYLPDQGSSNGFILTELPADAGMTGIRIYNGYAVVMSWSLELFYMEYTGETLRERSVVAQPTPVRGSRGSFYVSLATPESETFTATFDVALPPKFTPDAGATQLAASLAGGYDLAITAKGGGVWSFEIKPKALRSAPAGGAFREIANVAYTVAPDLEDGRYELKITNLTLALGDGTVIEEEEIVIPVLFDSASGNEAVSDDKTKVWSSPGGLLHVLTPASETVTVYSPSGAAVFRAAKDAGPATFRPNRLPRGVYIVRGGHWAKKIIVR